VLGRSGASLTAIDGRLYLFGGQDPMHGACFNDLHVLDPATWEWSEARVEGGRPPPRHSHVACRLGDGALVVFGGATAQGTLADVWIYNPKQGTWTRPSVDGAPPAGREMAAGAMVGPTTLLVYGGRASDGRVLCDAALLDLGTMRWGAAEPTPFARCAQSAVAFLPATADTAGGGDASASGADGAAAAAGGPQGPPRRPYVVTFGGFSGEAVEGDLIRLDGRTLEVEQLDRGPRRGPGSPLPPSSPADRFAHAAVGVADASGATVRMLVIGGVNPAEDLSDVAVWTPAA
jgi:hypothetical protein